MDWFILVLSVLLRVSGAKHDLYNGVTAGCITGAGLAIKGGPQAAFIGCAGFAAFSLAIDMYLSSDAAPPPKNDYDL